MDSRMYAKRIDHKARVGLPFFPLYRTAYVCSRSHLPSTSLKKELLQPRQSKKSHDIFNVLYYCVTTPFLDPKSLASIKSGKLKPMSTPRRRMSPRNQHSRKSGGNLKGLHNLRRFHSAMPTSMPGRWWEAEQKIPRHLSIFRSRSTHWAGTRAHAWWINNSIIFSGVSFWKVFGPVG